MFFYCSFLFHDNVECSTTDFYDLCNSFNKHACPSATKIENEKKENEILKKLQKAQQLNVNCTGV